MWRYLNKPSIVWALFTGLFTGFALATKETWIIGFFAVIFACFFSFRDETSRGMKADMSSPLLVNADPTFFIRPAFRSVL